MRTGNRKPTCKKAMRATLAFITNANGTNSSDLVDGNLAVEVGGTAEDGNTVTDSMTRNLDPASSDLPVDLTNAPINLSGTVNDTVTDFTIDPVNGFTATGQGDQLELSDLLQGANADGSTTAVDISGYLIAKEDSNGDTVLYLNKDGALNDDSANAQQSITLSGVTMDGQTSDQFIDAMLNNEHIKIE